MTRRMNGRQSKAKGQATAWGGSGLLALVFAVALVLTPQALAQGGNPSQAFRLTAGKTAHGDTSRQTPDGRGDRREFWSIALKAGDYVTVDWSQPVSGPNYLYPLKPGINDNNFTQAETSYGSNRRSADATGHDEFQWRITRTGRYYFDFISYNGYDGGAYEITVHVRRGLRRSDVPSVAPLARPGHWYSGDTSRHVPDANGLNREFWKIKLRAGDTVTLVWSEPNAGASRLHLLGPGTNNNNFVSVEGNAVYSYSDATGHGRLQVHASRTGYYFLDARVGSDNAGAYRFRFAVRHRT